MPHSSEDCSDRRQQHQQCGITSTSSAGTDFTCVQPILGLFDSEIYCNEPISRILALANYAI